MKESLHKKDDKIEVYKMPLSPTNLYSNFCILINGKYEYFYKRAVDPNAQKYFEDEIQITLKLSDINISPEVCYFDLEKKVIMSKYIKSDLDKLSPQKLEYIINKLKQFHSMNLLTKDSFYNLKKKLWLDRFEKLPQKVKKGF